MICARSNHSNHAGLLLVLFLATTQAWGHGLLLVGVRLVEQRDGSVLLSWKAPLQAGPGALRYSLQGACRAAAEMQATAGQQAWRVQQAWRCVHGLGGVMVVSQGPASAVAQTALQVHYADGASHTALLGPTSAGLRLPRQPHGMEVWWFYGILGVRHILAGVDHLLFVAGLMLLVVRGCSPHPLKQLAGTISGFTVGHSMTLSLAALADVAPAPPPTEAAIALSILYLAHELASGTVVRRPWLLSSAFGLLHGFGFAGALAETGLPHGQRIAALLAFNGGVEAGQLMFLGLVWPLLLLWQRTWQSSFFMQRLPIWIMGVMAGYWFVTRSAWLWS
jgi:hypothetical protein